MEIEALLLPPPVFVESVKNVTAHCILIGACVNAPPQPLHHRATAGRLNVTRCLHLRLAKSFRFYPPIFLHSTFAYSQPSHTAFSYLLWQVFELAFCGLAGQSCSTMACNCTKAY